MAGKKEEETQVKDKPEKEKILPQKPEEEVITIDLKAEKDEDKDDGKDEDKADRQERKRERYDKFLKENREATEAAQAEARRAREEAMAVRIEMARLQGKFEATSKGGADPYQEALEKNWQDRQDLFDALSAKKEVTIEEHNRAKARFRQLEREAMELVAKKGAADFYREQQKNAPNPRQAAIRAQYVDVLGTDDRPNQAGLNHFSAYFYNQRAQGRPVDEPLIIESLEYARKALSPQRPTEREKVKLAGSSVGGGDVGGHSDGIVKLGARQRQMADVTFKSIKDPQERYRKWAEKFNNIQKGKSA